MNYFKVLKNKIKNKNCKIAIIGLGYVGLPLAMRLIKEKFNIVGVDVNSQLIQKLRKGKSYLTYVKNSDLNYFKKYKHKVSTKFDIVKNSDIIIYCLPTPLKGKNPDLTFLKKSLKSSFFFFKKGQLIVIESTSYPGTTRELVDDKYFKKYKFGKDFFIGYSPEREDPGRKINYKLIPKLVSGLTEQCLKLTRDLYKNITNKVVSNSSIEAAEITKLYENIFRAVNIGLANEMKIICDKLNLDIHEVIDSAKTKPYGFYPFYPGPGWGGHCIPVDPFYLTWKIKKIGLNSNFIESAGKINNQMPYWLINKLVNFFKKKNIKKKFNFLIIGAAYKPNVSDTRESPSLKIMEILKKKNINFCYFDPYVKKLPATRIGNFNISSIDFNKKNISKFDASIIVTDHKIIDYKKLLKFSKYVFDTRNVYKNIKNYKIIRA